MLISNCDKDKNHKKYSFALRIWLASRYHFVDGKTGLTDTVTCFVLTEQ